MNAKKIVTVPKNGQVSLGKDFAGMTLQLEVLDYGAIVLTPVDVIPTHHRTFHTDDAQARLDAFKSWSRENPLGERKTDAEDILSEIAKGKA